MVKYLRGVLVSARGLRQFSLNARDRVVGRIVCEELSIDMIAGETDICDIII
jgi:hypothetical protein